MSETDAGVRTWACRGLLVSVGIWVCYRAVNLPVFADFLIAVEAEMNKVSWPSRAELYRGRRLVVLIMLTVVLFGLDIAWAGFPGLARDTLLSRTVVGA